MPGLFRAPRPRQGCGPGVHILGSYVYTANMTAHSSLDQRQQTQYLGGWPKPNTSPAKKTGGGRGIAVFQRVFLENASSKGYPSGLWDGAA